MFFIVFSAQMLVCLLSDNILAKMCLTSSPTKKHLGEDSVLAKTDWRF